jgi:hypothetical protein
MSALYSYVFDLILGADLEGEDVGKESVVRSSLADMGVTATVESSLVESSLEYVCAVTAAVPVDAEDERLVDALVARKMATTRTRLLQRKL